MLEDDFTDVLRKALIANGCTVDEVARKAGIDEKRLADFSAGDFSEVIARKIAPVLGLRAEAYAALVSYHPRRLAHAGIIRMDLPFEAYRVNAWYLYLEGASVLVDTGFEKTGLLDQVPAHPNRVLITHAHRDHVGGLKSVLDAGIPVHGAGIDGAHLLAAGDVISCGAIEICACDLSGHAMPALGFLMSGFEVPIVVLGDALFAGSIGKCSTPAVYQHAKERLHAVLDEMPDQTVLLPGHGPATTLGEERVSNPFW